MKIFMVSTEKKSLFHFVASDVITDVAKQNRNIMTSILSAYHKKGEEQVFWQIKIILIPECSLLSN